MGWFATKPKVPKAPKVELAPTLSEMVKANASIMPEISNLAKLYSAEELANMDQVMPGLRQTQAAGLGTTQKMFEQAGQELMGNVPEDVQNAIQRSTAYQSLAGGFGGSPMARALTARDLGRTSLDLIGQGAQLAGQGANTMQIWDNLARRNMLDPGSMFATPGLATNLAMENAVNKYNRQQYKANIDAQATPWMKQVHDTVLTLTAAYLGSMGGGGMGGMGGGGGSGGGGGTTFNQGASYGNAANPGFSNPGFAQDVYNYG
jgi:hypothetical protein